MSGIALGRLKEVSTRHSWLRLSELRGRDEIRSDTNINKNDQFVFGHRWMQYINLVLAMF